MSNKSWTFGLGKEEAIIEQSPQPCGIPSLVAQLSDPMSPLPALISAGVANISGFRPRSNYLVSAVLEITIHVDSEAEVCALEEGTTSVLS